MSHRLHISRKVKAVKLNDKLQYATIIYFSLYLHATLRLLHFYS